MKHQLSPLLFCLLLSLFTSSALTVAHADHSPSLRPAASGKSKNLTKRDAEILTSSLAFEKAFVRSVVPTTNVAPPTGSGSNISSYVQYFERTNRSLLPLFEPVKNQSPFTLKRYRSVARAFVGYPSYLEAKIAPTDIELGQMTVALRQTMSDFLSAHADLGVVLSNDEPSANLFLIPVTAETYINVVNPNRVIDPTIAQNYEHVLSGLKEVLFNHNVFETSIPGLHGTFINDEGGNILAAYCPVAMGTNKTSLNNQLFYCLVQSQGLPGFHNSYPENTRETAILANKLLHTIRCDQVEAGQSLFDIDIPSLFTSCQEK